MDLDIDVDFDSYTLTPVNTIDFEVAYMNRIKLFSETPINT